MENRNSPTNFVRVDPELDVDSRGAKFGPHTMFVFDRDDNWVGLTCGFTKKIFVGEELKCSVHTGLSVDPEKTKHGIAQLIHHTGFKMDLELGMDTGLFWYDGLNNKKGHSLTIFRNSDKEICGSSAIVSNQRGTITCGDRSKPTTTLSVGGTHRTKIKTFIRSDA